MRGFAVIRRYCSSSIQTQFGSVVRGSITKKAVASEFRFHVADGVGEKSIDRQQGDGLARNTSKTWTRSFYGTSISSQAVRRRRRRGGAETLRSAMEQGDHDDDENSKSPTIHAAEINLTKFEAAAEALLDKVGNALEPMKKINDYFVVSRTRIDGNDSLTLDLGPGHGAYVIEVELEERKLAFQSPISGTETYVLSAETGDWVSSRDGHHFEELLVRDLIRQVRGVPQL